MKTAVKYFLGRLASELFWGAIILLFTILIFRVVAVYIPKHSLSQSNAELERIRKELSLAEIKWRSHKITDYEIDATAVINPLICSDFSKNDLSPWHLKIRQNEIIFDNEMQKGSVEGCKIADFLPPKVFDTIRQKLDKANPQQEYLKIEFDPEYGFMSDYSLTGNYSTSGVFVHFMFSNFHPTQSVAARP